MSDRPHFIFNKQIIAAGDMSGNLISPSVDIAEIATVSIQATYSNGVALAGDITLEASLDDINFTTIADSSSLVSGANGSCFYNVMEPGYRYIRIVYMSSAGSGDLDVRISGKR